MFLHAVCFYEVDILCRCPPRVVSLVRGMCLFRYAPPDPSVGYAGGNSLGNSWRIAGDGDTWPALTNCFNTIARVRQYSGPGEGRSGAAAFLRGCVIESCFVFLMPQVYPHNSCVGGFVHISCKLLRLSATALFPGGWADPDLLIGPNGVADGTFATDLQARTQVREEVLLRSVALQAD